MHGWDIMSQSNYDTHQNWCGGTTMIKPEPQTDVGPYTVEEQKPLLPMMMRGNDSNPTSPHSIGSDESSTHQQNIYYNDHMHNLINGNHLHRPLGFNPLTPPGYPNVCVPQTSVADSISALPTTPTRGFTKADTTAFPLNPPSLTPSHTPPMDQTPPKSPKFRSDISEKDATDLDNSSLSGDETKSLYSDYNQEIAVPKVNSHGKMKTHKCKHCEFVAVTKKDFWEHSRQHIKPERQIQCSKCPFVTEYKHHFEYHLRNHEGSKPFKCPECNYTCVNKSMLNSHLKSHSDIYQYRCDNCSYATKYVHSLKLHLRKYDHHPALPLDSDGMPDAGPVIDVYGTRRGPKKRASKLGKITRGRKTAKAAKVNPILPQMPAMPQQSPTKAAKMQPPPPAAVETNHPQMPNQQQLQNLLPSILPNHFANMFPYFNLNIQMLAAHQQALAAAQLSPNRFGNHSHSMDDDDEDEEMCPPPTNKLDITNPESPTSSVPNNHSNGGHHRSLDDAMSADESSFVRERKVISTPKQCNNDRHTSVHDNSDNNNATAPTASPAPAPAKTYDCKYCGISFQDAVLHTIHMGYHGYNDVFTCNMCGEKCTDRISFFLHIAKNEH